MEKKVYSSSSRGVANYGWLLAKYSFSFANYYDPSKMNFGVLRVFNDDIVAPGMGFGTHPHDNMEIITIPLSGAIEHIDSMGNSSVINTGEIQVMSAGSGVTHSEFNPSNSKEVNLFQIWIFPNKRNVDPRYDQFIMDVNEMKNNFLQLVSPYKNVKGTWIHQDAWIYIAEIEVNRKMNYQLNHSDINGVFVMVIEGGINILSENLNRRDAIGVWDIDSFEISAISNSTILLLEIPMNIG